jgi:hypothetical protein
VEKCVNHPGRPALSFCFTCKRHFCSQCLVEGSEHYYCKAEECQKMWEREVLPAEIRCPHCAVELELDENERKRKQLHCPICKKSIDLRESSHLLGKAFAESALSTESFRLTGESEPLISDTEEGEKEYRCLFEGDGASLFGIYFFNGLLSGGIFFVLSLLMMAFVGISGESGISIPLIIIWYITFILAFAFVYAFLKFRIYEFYYSNVKFGDGHLFFTGTLKEIYKGILKALLFAVVFAIAFFVLIFAIGEFVGLSTIYFNLTMQIIIYLTLFVVLQYAYFNSRRYRFSRILYRRKVFSLNGDLIQFTKKCILNGLFSIFTLGIYLPIYFHRRFAMLFNNLYYGNEPFRYEGKDKEFFKITLEGFFIFSIYVSVRRDSTAILNRDLCLNSLLPISF